MSTSRPVFVAGETFDVALRTLDPEEKPCGQLLVLEFSKPVLPMLASVYDTYSFSVLPALGRVVAKDADSYRYLAESIRMFPDQATLELMLKDGQWEKAIGGIDRVTVGCCSGAEPETCMALAILARIDWENRYLMRGGSL